MSLCSQIVREFKYKAIRSSGSGGQHVNKVATKVELIFDIGASKILTKEAKQKIIETLRNRLTKNNVFILQCGESRSQLKNKNIVTQRALNSICTALKVKKERIPTKIPKAILKKRLKNKRIHAQLKASRRKPEGY